MPFIARISLPGALRPTRAYLYEPGFEDGFGSVKGARDYLAQVLDVGSKINGVITPADYILAALWSDKDSKVAELFGYGGISDWPGNPEVYSWVFKDGIYLPGQRKIACGEATRILGTEEDYRITTKSLKEFMEKPPQLRELEPRVNF
jgi:hypothetical protein